MTESTVVFLPSAEGVEDPLTEVLPRLTTSRTHFAPSSYSIVTRSEYTTVLCPNFG